jgi:hypothetical protein
MLCLKNKMEGLRGRIEGEQGSNRFQHLNQIAISSNFGSGPKMNNREISNQEISDLNLKGNLQPKRDPLTCSKNRKPG